MTFCGKDRENDLWVSVDLKASRNQPCGQDSVSWKKGCMGALYIQHRPQQGSSLTVTLVKSPTQSDDRNLGKRVQKTPDSDQGEKKKKPCKSFLD